MEMEMEMWIWFLVNRCSDKDWLLCKASTFEESKKEILKIENMDCDFGKKEYHVKILDKMVLFNEICFEYLTEKEKNLELIPVVVTSPLKLEGQGFGNINPVEV